MTRCGASSKHHADEATSDTVNPAQIEKFKSISKEYQGSADKGSVSWSKTYPTTAADPSKIAADINANLPPLKDD